MRVITGSISMDLIEIGSKGELDGELRHCDRAIRLDNCLDPTRFYYYVSHFGTQKKHGIGIFSEISCFSPDLLIDEKAGMLWFGWDTWAAAISINKFEIISQNSLSGPFFEFIALPKWNRVLIEFETGVLCHDTGGNLLWKYDESDIVTGLDVKEDCIEISLMDSPTVTLDVVTGNRRGRSYWGTI